MSTFERAITATTDKRDDPRLGELRRMRLIATSLLVGMAAIFVVTRIFEERWPWLGYVRAFAEASMVGACADWFAVVALFRHPLRVPIPHTAIVPRNKERIADAIGGFITRNFLEPAVVSQRLATIDAIDWWARHLAKPENAARVARRAIGFLAPFVEISSRPQLHAFLSDTTRRGLLALPAAPLAGRVLAILLDSGQLMELAEKVIEYGSVRLERNDAFVRAKVSEKSSWWIPKWVDGKMADRLLSGARGSLAEMRAPNHPWRGQFADYIKRLTERLAADPAMREAGTRLQAEIFENPAVAGWLQAMWREVEAKLKDDIATESGFVQAQLERALYSAARLLHEDEPLRETINGWIRHTIEAVVVPHRAEIGTFISDVVKKWDDGTLVGKMEMTFGKDLQYIRINGTLVGGLVGLVIYAATELATHFAR